MKVDLLNGYVEIKFSNVFQICFNVCVKTKKQKLKRNWNYLKSSCKRIVVIIVVVVVVLMMDGLLDVTMQGVEKYNVLIMSIWMSNEKI